MKTGRDSEGSRRLTARQKRFVGEYCVARRRARANTGAMFNGTQLAIAAGYSPKSARQMAAENLSKPYIRGLIDARMAGITTEASLRGVEVLERLSRIGRMEIEKNPKLSKEILGALIALVRIHGLFDRKEKPEDRTPEDLPPTMWVDFGGASAGYLRGSVVARELASVAARHNGRGGENPLEMDSEGFLL